jgi:hypothetical protein
MKQKEFKVNGATILVLQTDGWLDFSMLIKSTRYFHCITYRGKIEDVTEEDAIDIWNRYHKKVGKLEDAWIAELKRHSKRQKPWRKRKKGRSESSEPIIREIRP